MEIEQSEVPPQVHAQGGPASRQLLGQQGQAAVSDAAAAHGTSQRFCEGGWPKKNHHD